MWLVSLERPTDGNNHTFARRIDLDSGTDRLLGAAERLVTKGFREGAADMVDVLSKGKNDDTALVVIWRS